MIDLKKLKLSGFDWDKGNKDKNWLKHKVESNEAEEIFYNESLPIFEDLKHQEKEKRLVAYGFTDKGRALTVIFVLRKDKQSFSSNKQSFSSNKQSFSSNKQSFSSNKIRVISARNQSRKERSIYEKNKSDS